LKRRLTHQQHSPRRVRKIAAFIDGAPAGDRTLSDAEAHRKVAVGNLQSAEELEQAIEQEIVRAELHGPRTRPRV